MVGDQQGSMLQTTLHWLALICVIEDDESKCWLKNHETLVKIFSDVFDYSPYIMNLSWGRKVLFIATGSWWWLLILYTAMYMDRKAYNKIKATTWSWNIFQDLWLTDYTCFVTYISLTLLRCLIMSYNALIHLMIGHHFSHYYYFLCIQKGEWHNI